MEEGKRKFLVAGIDVGVHVGIALIDIDGNIALLESLRSPTLSGVLETILRHGNVFSVSTDKQKMPSRAKKIASALGAREVSPAKNLTNKKKRILIEDFLGDGKIPLDSHAKAALAAAIFGYRKCTPKLKKLREKLEKNGKAQSFEKVREKYLLGQYRISQKIKEAEGI